MISVENLSGRIFRKILRFFPQQVEFSMGELMLQREEMTHAQFAISALVLDVENYCNNGDSSFYYQNVGHRIRHGADFNTAPTCKRFRDTIDSIIRDGYLEDSFLDVGNDLTLHNGSHRAAICIYLKHYFLKGKAYRFRSPFFLATAKELIQQMGYPQKYVEDVVDEYNKIQETLIGDGVSYACFVDNESLPKEVLVKEGAEIQRIFYVKPESNTEKNDSNRMEIDKRGTFCQFTLKQPDFRIKSTKVISKACERIERNFKKNYPNMSCWVSKNCLEGKELFDKLKPFNEE